MNRSLVSDYRSALEFLRERINYERTTAVPYRTGAFKLDRMRTLLGLLGDPHLGLAVVHIAGTKGKGSTAAMTAAVLGAAGLRTGLYTSPHLDVIEERIAIGGAPCTPNEFVALAAELSEAVGRLKQSGAGPADDEETDPTFFEVTTAMAFLHFARQKVDAAVLEVGLGGRLDSTNVCRPRVCILTSISFDHTRQLGHTLAAIAGEKAGIIKKGVPVVSGVVDAEPQVVVRETADECGAPLYELGRDFALESPSVQTAAERLDYREPAEVPTWQLRDVPLGMIGRHQAANAALAIAAIRRLIEQGWSIDEGAIRRGLAEARCPARIEVVGSRPLTIVDVAHNVASIAALLEVLNQRFALQRGVLIFASSRDKDTAGMLRLLMPRFETVILTRYIENPRAVEIEQLTEWAAAESGGRQAIHVAPTPAAAWSLARSLAGEDDLICITGSFFLAAELRPLVAQSRLEPVPKP